MSDNSKTFTQAQIQAIADALGHTDEGLTGTEIGHLLQLHGSTTSTPH